MHRVVKQCSPQCWMIWVQRVHAYWVYLKWLWKPQECFPHHDEEKNSCHTHTHTHTHAHIYIYIYPQSFSFGGAAQQLVDLRPLDFYLWGHLKPLLYSSPIENEGTLHQRFSDVCQTNRNRFGAFASVRQSMIRSVRACSDSPLRTFWAFVVNRNLMSRTQQPLNGERIL